MKKFSIVILFLFSFFMLGNMAVYSLENVDVQPETQQVQQVKSDDLPETIPEKNYENLMKIKDSEIYSKFINVLFYLAVTIAVLLCVLGLYKFRKKHIQKNMIVDGPPKETLLTPTDFKSAINLFLGKTDE